MLRIHVGRFPRRDAKKLRIELIDRFDKSAAQRDGFSSHPRFGVVISLDVKAIGRHLNDAFPAFDEKFPKGFLRTHATGKTATDSNYCNTFVWHGRGLLRRGGLFNAACEHVKSATNPDAGYDVHGR